MLKNVVYKQFILISQNHSFNTDTGTPKYHARFLVHVQNLQKIATSQPF